MATKARAAAICAMCGRAGRSAEGGRGAPGARPISAPGLRGVHGGNPWPIYKWRLAAHYVCRGWGCLDSRFVDNAPQGPRAPGWAGQARQGTCRGAGRGARIPAGGRPPGLGAANRAARRAAGAALYSAAIELGAQSRLLVWPRLATGPKHASVD
ncbi:MAG: hypothetical protein J3K34DRAFT_424966 [Monoraphidium minutum]|nr:MAG: hypothetical protein J3K34DRAFT_424966 [Monoraphidium minutum]